MVVIIRTSCQRSEMGLVLWIDQNEFASNLVERVFKKKGLAFYTIPRPLDFIYLVDDLKPSVVVLDGETILKDLVKFQTQYASSENLRKTPTIIIGSWADLDFIEKKQGILTRPFDPFTIPAFIQETVKL